MAAEVTTDMEGMVHADQEEPTLFEIKEMLIVYKFQLRLSLKENWSPKINLVFIVSFGRLGHIKSSFVYYFNSRVAIHERIGFEIGIFPLFGLCHCGLATDVSGVL